MDNGSFSLKNVFMTCPGWSLRKNMKGSREGNMKDLAGKFTEGTYHCEPKESQVDVFDVRRFHNLQHNSQNRWPEGTTTVVLCWGKYHYYDYMFTTITTLCNCMFPFPRRGPAHDFADRVGLFF